MSRACGHAHHGHDAAHGVPALEMTKWFDTNYHYMVPELAKDQKFTLASRKPIEEYRGSARRWAIRPAPCWSDRSRSSSSPRARTPDSIRCRCSTGCCRSTSKCCANWSIAARNGCRSTSPAWCSTSISSAQQALHYAYAEIAKAVPQLKIMLATYFGGLGGNRDTALALPVAGLHLDLVRAPDQIDDLAKAFRRTACCRSASSTAATSGAPI